MAVGTIYIDSAGAPTNSGTTDQNSPDLEGSDASWSGTTTIDLSNDSPDLSGIPDDGSQAIYIDNATNNGQKIFWITGVNNSTKTVTVNVAPTGSDNSAWAIGGRTTFVGANFQRALRSGDTAIINNSPGVSVQWNALDYNNDCSIGRWITIKGKDGVRPVLFNSSNFVLYIGKHFRLENLDMYTLGTSNCVSINGSNELKDCRITGAGQWGISLGNWGLDLINVEVTGCGTQSSAYGGCKLNQHTKLIGCYIHDNGGPGLQPNQVNPILIVKDSIIANNGTYGIDLSATHAADSGNRVILVNNTIYGNGSSGLRSTNQHPPCALINNIFVDNGGYNVEFGAAGGNIQLSHNNIFYQSASPGENFSNFLPGASDLVDVDPLLVDPDNEDFSLSPSSPARATGYPAAWPGLGFTSYLEIGGWQDAQFSAMWLGDTVLDGGLDALATTEDLHLCSDVPTDYTEATATYSLGSGPVTVGSPEDAAGGGRKVVVPLTTVTADSNGTPACWALVDNASPGALLAYGPITAIAMTDTYRYDIESFEIKFTGL